MYNLVNTQVLSQSVPSWAEPWYTKPLIELSGMFKHTNVGPGQE